MFHKQIWFQNTGWKVLVIKSQSNDQHLVFSIMQSLHNPVIKKEGSVVELDKVLLESDELKINLKQSTLHHARGNTLKRVSSCK